jgi:hypothetical protein
MIIKVPRNWQPHDPPSGKRPTRAEQLARQPVPEPNPEQWQAYWSLVNEVAASPDNRTELSRRQIQELIGAVRKSPAEFRLDCEKTYRRQYGGLSHR